jgi:uncharacterized oligopeptide transporter (OPT) family protein
MSTATPAEPGSPGYLGLAGLVAAIDKVWAEGLSTISARASNAFRAGPSDGPAEVAPRQSLRSLVGPHRSLFLGFHISAAGAITGIRVGATMFVSGTLCWAVVAPVLQTKASSRVGFAAIVQWTLWFGASCMVAAGLLSFALSWRTALSAFRDLDKCFLPLSGCERARPHRGHRGANELVCRRPDRVACCACLAGQASFGMPVWQSAIAVALSFLLALVACRVTGETDTTPISAMGKVTQLTFGALSPGNVNVNLMSANITAGAASSAADLLTDLKSGYLLGAHPRQQFLAQFSGIFVGTVVSVLTFAVLVPNAQVLGTDQFPAPAAQTWSAVAIALGQGLSSLEPSSCG